MKMDAITLFKQAAAQLQQEEAYLYFAHARQQNDENADLQEKIGAFNLVRMELQQTMGNGEEETAKAEALNNKLSEMYTEIMDTEAMKNYNEAKQGMDAVMNYINAIVQAALNGEDPMLVEEPSGCTGDCSSCGGCH